MHSARARVDLVMIDVVMPKMDGVELANQIWEQWPGKHILFTSGYAAEVLTQHGLAHVDVPFLAKPYTRDEALGKVHEALKRSHNAEAESPAERRRKPRLKGK
jgi:YesN/AraC family two-component response regulator